MGWLLTFNVVFFVVLGLVVWALARFWKATRRARFHVQSAATRTRGSWIAQTRWALAILIALEVILAFSEIVSTTQGLSGLVAGYGLNRLLVALLLAAYVAAVMGPLSDTVYLLEEGLLAGWLIEVRYDAVQSMAWLPGNLLEVRSQNRVFLLSIPEADRESIARFLGEKTGKIVPATSAASPATSLSS